MMKSPKQRAITQKEYNKLFGAIVDMIIPVHEKLILMLEEASKYKIIKIRKKRGSK